jgi:hypothetical protein
MSIWAILRTTLAAIGAASVTAFALAFAWAFTRERKRLKETALTEDERRAFKAIARELGED